MVTVSEYGAQMSSGGSTLAEPWVVALLGLAIPQAARLSIAARTKIMARMRKLFFLIFILLVLIFCVGV